MKNGVFWDIFTALTTKDVVFWDRRNEVLLRTDVSEEATCSSETPVLTRATRRHIPEDNIHQTWIQFTFLD
jgi:hypothetical protein